MFESALQDMQSLYSGGLSRAGHRGCIIRQDVLLWTFIGQCSVTETFDIVGLGIAKHFADGKLSWEFCDEQINDLFSLVCGFILDPVWEFDEPDTFYAVYEAFDISEMAGSLEHAERVAIEEITKLFQQHTDH